MGLCAGEAAKALQEALVGFCPESYSGPDCAALAENLSRTAKACSAAAARAAASAADRGAYRARGFTDPAEWFARARGTSPSEAKAAMDTIGAVQDCPQTNQALVKGELSLGQAAEIARTEHAVPGSEAELLELAKGSSLKALRDTALDRRLGAVDPEELHRSQHKARSLRRWKDGLGMHCGRFALPPEEGVAFFNRLDDETDRIRRAARRDGGDEPREAYAADALARLVEQGASGTSATSSAGTRTRSRTDLVVVADLEALRRGHTHPGEACHIVGGGPIPVWLARDLSTDAFIKAVLHDGVDIHTVKHFGRHIRAELRTALEVGIAPEFHGMTCCEPGCGRQYNLEWDHVDPVANGGPTSFDNLKPRCWPHHRDKTERDRKAGLLRPKVGAERGPP